MLEHQPRHQHNCGDYLPAGPGRVYYETEGAGPAVLVVPGGPGAAHAHYHPWFSALADSHTVIYFDQLGTGRSDRLASGYSVGLYAETIRRLLQHLELEAAHLIGISFGGIAAAEVAASSPEQVMSLVLVDAQVDAHGWQMSNIDNVNDQLSKQYPQLWRQVMNLREDGVRSSDAAYQDLIGPAVEVLEWAGVDHPELAREPAYRFDYDTYLDFLGSDPEWTVGGSLQGHTVLDRLARQRIPLLIITGRHDRVTTPAVAFRVAEALRVPAGGVVTFERSGHRPWAEQPDDFFPRVRGFLSQHQP